LLEFAAPLSGRLTEADVETLATDWFRSLGYDCATGAEISADGSRPLRESVSGNGSYPRM